MESEHETSEMELSESDNQLKMSATEDSAANDGGSDDIPRGECFAERQGVLKQLGDAVLISTGQPLCVPVTQVGGAYVLYAMLIIIVLCPFNIIVM